VVGRLTASYSQPNAHGSLSGVPNVVCERMKGKKTPVCSQRAYNSPVAGPVKPLMSLPTNGNPERPNPMTVDTDWRSEAQSVRLSPVQTAAYRWPPAKVARVSTK